MADPADIAQATVLEVPVTVQGSRTVEGTERRELFTESTKTTFVSDYGAVLKLNAKVLPGQCVFLRNDQSGKEILCKVMESTEAAEAGYTHLKFSLSDPKFWDGRSEQPAAAITQNPVAQKGIEAGLVGAGWTPSMEASAPANGEVPATIPETTATTPASPSPEMTGALHKPSNGADGTEAKSAVPDWDEARDAQLLAVLAKMGGETKVQRQSAPKESKGTKDTAQEAATAGVQEQGQVPSTIASEAPLLSMLAPWIRRVREFTPAENRRVAGIAAALLIVVVLGVAWHAKRGSSTPTSNRPPAVSAQSAQKSPTAAAQPSQSSALAAAQSLAAKAPAAGAARSTQAIEDSAASAAAKVAATRDLVSSDPAAPGHAIHRRPKELNPREIIPAKIVSDAPPSIPPWANGLDLEPVVQLDALIDEKGNVVQTKPVSGPRLLQSAAQRAVALWVFEPALLNGKPAASHMVLTVRFQK